MEETYDGRRTPGEDMRLRIESMAFGGKGVARDSVGKVVFVPGTIPGEEVTVSIHREHRSFSEAILEEVNEPSSSRVAPFCDAFGACGGCDWQHIAYTSQVELKRGILAGFVSRAAGDDVPVEPEVCSPIQRGYRVRAAVRRAPGTDGLFGFYARASHEVVGVRECEVLAPGLRKALAGLVRAVREHGLKGVSSIDVKAPPTGALAVMSLESGRTTGVRALADRIRQSAEIDGLALVLPGMRRSVVSGKSTVDYDIRVKDRLVRYTCSIHGFIQANLHVNRLLVEDVMDKVAGSLRVLDLYAGSGNFAIPVSWVVGEVVAVDADYPLVDAGRRSAVINGCTNVRFVRGDAQETVRKLSGSGERFDTVILDPPRTGTREVAAAIDVLQPQRIVYVSCNPATLARDVSILRTKGFCVRSTRLYDMFPHTHHIESMTVLER